jgi:DNA-binding transcriptional LysR family regulator
MVKKTPPIGQISDYEIKHLRVFKTVVDCGGFSAAESELNIARPTISNHMASLESRLNMKLCKRGRAGFALTEEGRIIYEHATRLLASIQDFKDTVNNISDTPSGTLKIVLSDMLALDRRTHFPEIVDQFCEWAPNVHLSVHVKSMSAIERDVLNGSFDIGFIPYHRELEGLSYLHLFSDHDYLYCGRNHPFFDAPDSELTEEAIDASPLAHAGLDPHNEVYQKISSMNLAGDSYFYETRIALIKSGRYLGFLPENIAEPYVERGELKRIAPETKSYPLGIAVVIKKALSPNRARDYFYSTIKDVVAEDRGDTPPY